MSRMTPSPQDRGASFGQPRRCVLLQRPADGRTEPLVTGLSRRGTACTLVTSAPDAMVALAQGACALIVCQPRRVAQSRPLLAAVRRYFPRVVCRAFEPGAADAPPRLVALDDEAPAGVELPTPRDVDRPHQSPSSLLTHEELEMLIGEPVGSGYGGEGDL